MNSKGRVASFIYKDYKDCKILRWHLPKMLLHIRGWGRVNGPANITNVNVMISTQTKKTDNLSKLIWSKISTNRTHYELVVHDIEWKWDICLMRLRNRRNSTKISIAQNPDIIKSHRNREIYLYVLLTFTMYIFNIIQIDNATLFTWNSLDSVSTRLTVN